MSSAVMPGLYAPRRGRGVLRARSAERLPRRDAERQQRDVVARLARLRADDRALDRVDDRLRRLAGQSGEEVDDAGLPKWAVAPAGLGHAVGVEEHHVAGAEPGARVGQLGLG